MMQAPSGGKVYNFQNPMASPFCFSNPGNLYLQNELQNREYERKTSMSFPQFTQPQHTTQMNQNSFNLANFTQSPLITSGSPMLSAAPFNSGMQGDDEQYKQFFLPFPLPLPPLGQQGQLPQMGGQIPQIPMQMPPSQMSLMNPQNPMNSTPRFN
mmetsp:Transcript_21947/g.21133  ORF Transcript_21947/g.21133 Transcript_21947/m.21133 type:complete len:155 (+) Transcript_21947:1471-1935(+)